MKGILDKEVTSHVLGSLFMGVFIVLARDGASKLNMLHSNTLIGINGQRISLDELEITEGVEDSSENNTGSNGDEERDEGSTDNDNDSGDGEGESNSNNVGETSSRNEEVE